MRRYLLSWLYIFLGIAALYFITTPANAQWSQGKGHAYLKLGTWNQSSNTRFDSEGLLNLDPAIADEIGQSKVSYNIRAFYGHFGLDSKYNLTIQVPLVYAKLHEGLGTPQDFSSTNIGDMNLTIGRSLWNNDGFVGGAALTLGIPTGNTNPDGNSFLASGDGEFNQMVSLLMGSGYKIGEQNFYWKTAARFNHRTNGFHNEYRLSAETGATIGKWFGLVRATSTQFFNDDEGGEFVGNFLATNYERINIGAEATYYFNEKWGVSAGYNHILSGRNIINAPAITYGLVHKF